MTTRQDRAVREWQDRKAKREREDRERQPDPMPMPVMGMDFLCREAARDWGLAWDDWLRRPLVWRADMTAHFLIRGEREEYVQEAFKQRGERRRRDEGKSDPFAAQRREWMLSK